ncbi:hypothetical protein Taro_052846 [Colocasia esculenta]|uniref:Uncharacterized protein n=1 Tax=Colocasia esculenta TaxID=4460 RepID=A0A843XKW3_COLES|nr:hypothetical protein [Colocasia esculenta]
MVTLARATATLSRQGRESRQGHNGPMRRDYNRETGYGLAKFRSSPGARLLRACPVERLLPLPGTPILGSLLREYFGLRACSTTGRTPGGRDGGVVEVPIASSAPPSLLYVTLGSFRVSGSVGGNCENRVLCVGRGSGSRGRYRY